MIKKCKICGKKFEGRANKDYCSPKCRKDAEVSLRRAPEKAKPSPKAKKKKPPTVSLPPELTGEITKPGTLNAIASAYWDRKAPLLIKRGHLNLLSEDAFAELCDVYSRLQNINKAIDETNLSLLQIDDKWDNKAGTETQSFEESALSKLKRHYSTLFAKYSNDFYLTPKAVRGNFGIDADEEKDPLDEFIKGKNG